MPAYLKRGTSEAHRLAARLKETRKTAGITITQLATLLDLDRTQIYRLESGCGLMAVVRVKRIAEACGVSVEELLRLNDDPTPCARPAPLAIVGSP